MITKNSSISYIFYSLFITAIICFSNKTSCFGINFGGPEGGVSVGVAAPVYYDPFYDPYSYPYNYDPYAYPHLRYRYPYRYEYPYAYSRTYYKTQAQRPARQIYRRPAPRYYKTGGQTGRPTPIRQGSSSRPTSARK